MASRYQRDDVSNIFTLAVGVVVVATLYFASGVLLPLALAILFTFLLSPVVTLVSRLRIGRVPSTLIVVLLTMGAVGTFGWTVGRQVIDVTNQLPLYRTNIEDKIAAIHNSSKGGLSKAADALEEVQKDLDITPATTARSRTKNKAPLPATPANPVPVEVVPRTSDRLLTIPKLLGSLAGAGLVIIFTFFMLVQREDLRNRFIRLAGIGQMTVMTQALDEAAQRVSRYLLLQFVVNVCYGAIIAVFLYFIGIPNALLWGAIAGIFRFLPYVGPPLGAVSPLLLSLIVFNGWRAPLLTAGTFAILEILVAYFVEPMLYGAQTGVTPIAILFAAVFWTTVWGPIGLLVSTPLTVCLVTMGHHIKPLKFLQILLGDAPALAPEARFYQRLLATDQDEAREVLEADYKDKPLDELYDTVLIPALSLVEQDRHRAILDEETERFIFQSTRELVEEQFEHAQAAARSPEAQDAKTQPDAAGNGHGAQAVRANSIKVVCLPARDEADEIIGVMLGQLLQQEGYTTECLSVEDPAELLKHVARSKPDVVCISALPPLAIAYARTWFRKLHEASPEMKLVIGLWTFNGDAEKIATRIGASASVVTSTLKEAVQQVKLATEAEPKIVLDAKETAIDVVGNPPPLSAQRT